VRAVKDVIIMAGRNIYAADIERAAAPVAGVRPGCAVAVRLDAGLSREQFAIAVEAKAYEDHNEARRIQREVAHERGVAHEVFADVDVRPRNVVVLAPGMIRRTPSGRLRRAFSLALVTRPAPTAS
jgi:fatty-acyl-CoA synthase